MKAQRGKWIRRTPQAYLAKPEDIKRNTEIKLRDGWVESITYCETCGHSMLSRSFSRPSTWESDVNIHTIEFYCPNCGDMFREHDSD